MIVTCTGPKGEKFEGKTSRLEGHDGIWLSREMAEDRKTILFALETWCAAVGAKPEDAKETL